jgi:hypothetical protein
VATLLVRDEAAARWEREPPTGEIPENPPLEAQCQTPWKRPGALVEECRRDESAGRRVPRERWGACNTRPDRVESFIGLKAHTPKEKE